MNLSIRFALTNKSFNLNLKSHIFISCGSYQSNRLLRLFNCEYFTSLLLPFLFCLSFISLSLYFFLFFFRFHSLLLSASRLSLTSLFSDSIYQLFNLFIVELIPNIPILQPYQQPPIAAPLTWYRVTSEENLPVVPAA